MSLDGCLTLIAATALLVAISGPNVAMIVATSRSRGMRFGLLTVAGTTLGVAAQLGFLILGLTTLISAVAAVFEWLRWAGLSAVSGPACVEHSRRGSFYS